MLLNSFTFSPKHSPASNLYTTIPTKPQKLSFKRKNLQVFNCQPQVNPKIDEEKFHQETQDLILRSLTGQAAKKVLLDLQEADLQVAQWFNHFCADHSPVGDQFIEELMSQRQAKKVDIFTKKEHFISPIELAHRVLVMRAALADEVAKKLEFTTAFRTTEMQRKFLETRYKFEGVDEDLRSKKAEEGQKVEEETK